jgi:tRNA modification GTPase
VSSFEVLTPPGLAAVAVIRVAGEPRSLDLWSASGQPLAWPAPGHAVHALIRDEGRLIDEAVVLGTDAGAELHVHGGVGAVESVSQWLQRKGLARRTSQPAPAPGCLRHARALLSCEHGPLAELAGDARAALRAGRASAPLRERLRAALSRQDLARRLREPPRVRLVGQPNAGKSTLFNALLGSERSLVSPEAGTTRDTVRARLLVRGVPVVLEDTAGKPGAGAPAADADLLVHVLLDGEPAGRRFLRAPARLHVRSRADQRRPAPDAAAVSGVTGEGVAALLEAIAEALGLPADDSGDVLAPVDMALPPLFQAALALPDADAVTASIAQP